MVMLVADLVERDAVERGAHVVERVDRDPGAPDLAEAARVVGVEAELGGEVEGHAQARGAVLDQVAVALVRLLRARVARVLAHRPQLLAVHLAMHAAGEGELGGVAEPLVEVVGDVVRRVDRLDLDPAVREAPRVVRADDRRDGEIVGFLEVLVVDGHGPQITRPARWRGSPRRLPARSVSCRAVIRTTLQPCADQRVDPVRRSPSNERRIEWKAQLSISTTRSLLAPDEVDFVALDALVHLRLRGGRLGGSGRARDAPPRSG